MKTSPRRNRLRQEILQTPVLPLADQTLCADGQPDQGHHQQHQVEEPGQVHRKPVVRSGSSRTARSSNADAEGDEDGRVEEEPAVRRPDRASLAAMAPMIALSISDPFHVEVDDVDTRARRAAEYPAFP